LRKEIKKTPLAAWHEAHGANIVEFGGWDMPLWYPSGARSEHLAVITNAGLFDTSHMAVVTIAGPDTFDLLQLCFTKDLTACAGKGKAPLSPGRCAYGAYLNERGEVIDDTIIYNMGPELYMSVVNCGMGGKTAEHLKSHLDGRNVEVSDLTARVGKMDIQGPDSAKILLKILKDPEDVLRDMGYFRFKGYFDPESPFSDTLLSDGTPVLVSRTGYTGEFGFELFVNPDRLARAWEMILSAGEEFGLIPCGLAARDSLRAGAVLPLSHQDIGPWPFINNPWPFALPYNEEGAGFTKKFIGDIVLALKPEAEHTHAFVGRDPRKVSIGDPAVVLDGEGERIGTVLTCVADLAVGRAGDRIFSIASPDKPADFRPRGLVCGFVRVKSRLAPGRIVELKDNRRKIEVRIVDDIRPDRTARRPVRHFM